MPDATAIWEAGLLAWLYLVGVGLLWPLRDRYGSFVVNAFAFPTGLAAYVIVAWLAIVTPLPFAPLAVLAFVSMVGAIAVIASHRGGSRPIAMTDVLVVVVGVTALIAVSGAAQALNFTRVTPDSFRYVQIAGILVSEGGFGPVPDFLMFQRPMFLPLAYTLADVAGEPYLSSLAPVIGAAGLASLGALAVRGRSIVRARLAWILGLSGVAFVAVLLSNRGLYHLFYVNGHLAFGVYLMLAAASLWLAATWREPAWWIPVPLFMSVMVLSRDESTLVLALLIVPLFGSTAFRSRERWLIALPPIALSWLWFAGVLRSRAGGMGIEGSVDGGIIVTAGLTVFALVSATPGARRFTRWSGPSLLGGLWLAVPIMVAIKPDDMTQTLDATAEIIGGTGRWGTTWTVLPLVVLVLFALVRLPEEWFLTVPVVGFLPVLMAVSFFVGPYKISIGSPLTRMLMHGLLLSLLYVVLAAGAGAPAPDTEESVGS